ncbi:MAG: DNA methyltransferase [Promethearchaeota archaeon]
MELKKKNKKIELFNSNKKSRGFFDLKNRINFLTGKEWIFGTKSVIPKNFPPSFQLKLRNKHGGQKPPELCKQIIENFSKEGDLVLDPFAGVGGTLMGCSLSNRKGIGIELNSKWINIYKEVCERENLIDQQMIQGDSREVLKSEKISPDFILTDVPYWHMDTVAKSKGTYKKVGDISKGVFSDRSKLSQFNEQSQTKSNSKDNWKKLMKEVFTAVFNKLKPGKYCAVFIGNMYHQGKYHLLNAELTQIMEKIGFVCKGEIIWYDVSKKLHLYGINYSWIPSIVHQFIMIYRKERNDKISENEIEAIEKKNIEYSIGHS